MFAELMQTILAATVFDKGQRLVVAYNNAGSSMIGNQLSSTALILNNGRFLKFFMYYLMEPGKALTISNSSFQYQFDDAPMFSKHFIFRYDYQLHPEPNHPQSHLQINGDLKHPQVSGSELKDIRFPANRTSVESMLRLLITDFGLKPNNQDWEKILSHSEEAFLNYQASKRLSG